MDRKLRNFKWMVGYSANYSIPDDVDEVPLNLQDAVVEKYMEFVLGMGSQTAPRELSFLAVDAPPYIFANRVSNETLAMYGPLFSVFMEMAKKLNYRSVTLLLIMQIFLKKYKLSTFSKILVQNLNNFF